MEIILSSDVSSKTPIYTSNPWLFIVLDFGRPSISGSIRSIKMYSWD
jgi:hypothetical protein